MIPDRNLDPIQKTFKESPDFNRAWLQTDRPLNSMQRIGFLVLSTIIGLGGSMFFRGGLEDVRESPFSGCFFLFGGGVMLYLGIRGLWRVAYDVFSSK